MPLQKVACRSLAEASAAFKENLAALIHLKFVDIALQIVSRQHIKMLVWERGAGRTLACGTGACAAVVAGVLEGKIDRDCR